MHDVKLLRDWTNEAGQRFKAGVLLRVSLPLAHQLAAAGDAQPLPEGTVLPPLPPAPAPAPVAPAPQP